METVNDLVVVLDHRRHAVELAAEHGLSLTAPRNTYLAMELDLRAVAGLLALEDQLVDELHAERADEETRGREGGNDGCVHLVEFIQENLDVAHHR